ncbi:transmembrane amino acid transporter [Diplodia corticola]|uniref:Transmembrane amino acid transporter n=1 Tax=Diplodia corticola TaxID=236234 RepID=A0A1J9RC47_9PEZI|nr:transmembrane amino acid transporter [Diplodia corticola]OJD38033.1 transmembrane amino acid transporter [Diplodia corticola]
MSEEKKSSLDIAQTPPDRGVGDAEAIAYDKEVENEFEVFKKGEGVDFRTVSWVKATVIFLKIIFATGVLSIPTAMYTLGAVGGALSVVGWGALNTYTAAIQGDFRNKHAHCHSIADMAEHVGGPVCKEIAGALFIIAYVLCTGSGIIGVSTALNALSTHAACTNWWALLATGAIILLASIRKFERLAPLTWAGFVSIFAAVLTVVIGVTTLSRPAAAPPTGPYDLGYHAFPSPPPSFAAGTAASATIFVSSAGTSAFLPVVSEMRRPRRDYPRALLACMALVTAAYLAFSSVVYAWCGKWVASPSLGSGGPQVKKAAYGVGVVGLLVSACLYLHVAAKYVFVRALRGTRHLQEGTAVHWATWLGSVVGLGAVSFVLAQSIPIFNYILALTGTVCFAPLAISLPGWLWLFDHGGWRKGMGCRKAVGYWLHWGLVALGLFFLVGGTYAVVRQITDAYADGTIGSAFSCADNSGST